MKTRLLLIVVLALALCIAQKKASVVNVRPVLATASVSDDPDDPAIWVNPVDPARSLILGTNKVAKPSGALVVFGLDGKIRQTVGGLDRPNNVDVEYGLTLGGRRVDIAVITERLQHRLRVYRIEANGSGITDISSPGGLTIRRRGNGEALEVMGIALYKRRDGVIFAIVSPKSGPSEGYLEQYRLEDDGQGRVRSLWVRSFGRYSGKKEIEAVAVDDDLGYVYYGDETAGVRKYGADPDRPDAGRELAFFATAGFSGDHEGIAIYPVDGRTGYIVCTDQIDGNSKYHIYRREGAPGRPHDHSEELKIIAGGADGTDGIEVTAAALGPAFPHGMMVAMNSGPKNFLVFRWEDIAETGSPALAMPKIVALPDIDFARRL